MWISSEDKVLHLLKQKLGIVLDNYEQCFSEVYIQMSHHAFQQCHGYRNMQYI